MKEELISFETAKLAKEKGFDIYVNQIFKIAKKDNAFWNIKKGDIQEHGVLKLKNQNIIEDLFWEIYARPTQSLLQKWLREKHNLHIVIKPHYNSVQKRRWYSYAVIELIKTGHVIQKNGCLTYEDALEEALQEALKYIKNENKI